MTVTPILPNGRETDQDEWTFVIGMDAFRICRGQPPKYFTHDEVARWIKGCTPCANSTAQTTGASLRKFREQTEAEVFGYRTGIEDAAALYEQVNPASDDERIKGSPGAGAMGAVIEYRDKIRALATPTPSSQVCTSSEGDTTTA